MNASDPVNALLYYGYAVVEAEARRAINSVGLDPCVGYLHGLAGSKHSLAYDLQELYRWLVDLSIIQLLEDHKLGKSAFVTTEKYHTRLRVKVCSRGVYEIQEANGKKSPFPLTIIIA
jgi:CRISP-associated protein Cas1